MLTMNNKWRDYDRWNTAYSSFWDDTLKGVLPKLNTNIGDSGASDSMGASWAKNIGYGAAFLSGYQKYLQSNAYDKQADFAEQNAALSREQSNQVGQAGARAANATREKGQRMQGSARATYGASGVDTNVGSAGAYQDAIAYRAERDAQTTMQNTAIKQWALGNEAAQYDAQAQSYKNLASQQRKSSILNTLLNVASIYYGIGI